MHKTRYNSLRLALEISPKGPLLIKSGGLSADPSLPDMQFVRTFTAGGEESLYIPGASLKGVVRSFVEKALRTVNRRDSWMWACSTFPKNRDIPADEGNCVDIFDLDGRDVTSAEVYSKSCGACRIFGHTRLRGRAAFTDLLPAGKIQTETRYGVAISRLSHAVAQGPFEMEVAVEGKFAGALVLENYELWQLGLLAAALEAMNNGLLKMGFGKNRGFGEVRARVVQAQIEEIVPVDDQRLRGLAAFLKPDERAAYSVDGLGMLENAPQPEKSEALGFYQRRTYSENAWREIAGIAMAQALHA